MIAIRKPLLLLAFALPALSAQADWSGKGEAGLVLANGNTSARTDNAKLNIADSWGDWKETVDLKGLHASSAGMTTANQAYAQSQTNYALSPDAYWFGAVDYTRDGFGAFAIQDSATTGAGYKVYDNDVIKLALQLGVGVRQTKTADDLRSTQAVYTAGWNYTHVLSATTKVLDKFDLQSGSNDTRLHNYLGLEVKMAANLALALGYDVTHDTKAGPTRKATDSLTTANVVFSF